MTNSRSALIALLQRAYSGEQAAAYAYRGHWKSIRVRADRERIRGIEAEEWHHRELVGNMLSSLDAEPDRHRERRTKLIGRTLGALCRVTGWLAPMYGAGKLESGNIREYETAARLAREAGRDDLVDCLLEMAEVEWEHEAYFRERVLSHAIGRRLPLWSPPPPKATIRASYTVDSTRIVPQGRPLATARGSGPPADRSVMRQTQNRER